MHGEEAIYFEKKKILVEKFLLLRTMFTKKKRGEFCETVTVEKNDTA